jgi:hypothetical protein
VRQPPRIVENFDAVIDRAGKIVGVSDDFARLEAIERQAQLQFAGWAMAVRELSKTIGVPFSQIVTLGDMENDVPMFRQAGFSIAMGNASDAVKRQAREATLTNDEDGFAAAVERLILPHTAADR